MAPRWKRTVEPPAPVLWLESDAGAAGARRTFAELERRLGGAEGRRFYGAFGPEAGRYRACVLRQDDDDPAALGLEVGWLPGGLFLRFVHRGEAREIGAAFDTLPDDVARDFDRPSIEYFRREGEVVLLCPIRG